MKVVKIILAVAVLGIAANTQAQQRKAQMQKRTPFLQKADTNADGKISAEEFKVAKAEMEAQRLERRKERFAQMDVNGDGTITFEEFSVKPQKMQKADFDFASIDTDKDGFLSQEELKAFRAEHRMGKGKRPMGGKRRGNK